jgi:hypothetical protein
MKLQKSDFQFIPCGYGHYRVTYISPVTYYFWTRIISDMTIIDSTKNCENPKIKDLVHLKNLCKRNS